MRASTIQHAVSFPALLNAYRLIAFTGSGGKTSLAQWAASIAQTKKKRTIITTTTKIFPPPSECIITEDGESDFLIRVHDKLKESPMVIVASRFDHITGKLIGLHPQAISRLHHAGLADLILVEADGAARKPLKAPNATEPVIPPETDLCIAVMGLDATYEPLCESTVHRSDIFSFITGRSKSKAILPVDMYRIATAPDGLFKGCPSNTDRVVFLNKADRPGFEVLVNRFAALLEREKPLKSRWFAGSALQRQAREIKIPSYFTPFCVPPLI